jgi:hypothetical protein
LGLLEIELLCGTKEGTGYDGEVGAPAGSWANQAAIPVAAVGAFDAKFVNESPPFTAAGSGGGSLSLSRAFTPGGLLTLTPTFTYGAYLVDKTTNTKQKAFEETLTAETPFGTKSGGVSLTAGNTYAVQIESSTAAATLLGALNSTSSHFDNVVVTGPGGTENPPGPSGPGGEGGNRGNGGEGGNGADGSGGVSSAKLESLIGSSLVGPATVSGNKLSVKAGCPKKIGATCTISLQGMLNRHKAVTAGRKAKVKSGKARVFRLVVKPAARATVKTKSKLLFKETIQVGNAKATTYKTLKLVRK